MAVNPYFDIVSSRPGDGLSKVGVSPSNVRSTSIVVGPIPNRDADGVDAGRGEVGHV